MKAGIYKDLSQNMEFKGTSRFEVLSQLGSGGMGAVYEVIDRNNGQRLALKTLNLISGTALYQFKKEFRALAVRVFGPLLAVLEGGTP